MNNPAIWIDALVGLLLAVAGAAKLLRPAIFLRHSSGGSPGPGGMRLIGLVEVGAGGLLIASVQVGHLTLSATVVAGCVLGLACLADLNSARPGPALLAAGVLASVIWALVTRGL